MHLGLVEIENFRGIRSLTLKLDTITAVFGEGSFGKTSLLDALEVVLGLDSDGPAEARFTHEDFHVPFDAAEPPAKKLSIRLTFWEQTAGEWSSPRHTELAPVMSLWRDGTSQITVELSAEREGTAGPVTVSLRFLDADMRAFADADPAACLMRLRRLSPLLLLRPGRQSLESRLENPKTNHMTEEEGTVLSLYRLVMAEPQKLTRELLSEGLSAVSALGARYAELIASHPTRYHRLVRDIAETPVGLMPAFRRPSGRLGLSHTNQIMSLLVVLGAILEARGARRISSESEPILAVENVEANIHPIVLASVWDFLSQLPVQKIVITNSDNLLASVPLRSLRRMVKEPASLTAYRVRRKTLSVDDMRRIGYHLRVNRADAIMSRCWLLVEGESEFWLMPELAHICGYDFPAEGVRCVEFAQCGVQPLIRLATDLGIAWHVLSDGDDAGRTYRRLASDLIKTGDPSRHLTTLRERDIEHYLCRSGFAEVYYEAAGYKGGQGRQQPLTRVIQHALKRRSKPSLILSVVESVSDRGAEAVPPMLRRAIESCVEMARRSEPASSLSSPWIL